MKEQLPVDWVDLAKTYIGTREHKGPGSNQKILDMRKELGVGLSDDDVPWCGTFVGYCLHKSGRDIPSVPERALAYSQMGMVKLTRPAYGSVAVMSRQGGGHVGFVVGKNKAGRIMILGGNQNDEVNIKPFAQERILGFYWPTKEGVTMTPTVGRYDLPIYASDDKVSERES